MSRWKSVATSVVAVLVGSGLLAGCEGDERRSDPPERVCGLVDVDLVQKIVGDAEIDTSGSGITELAHRRMGGDDCHVWDRDRNEQVVQVHVGELADRGQWPDDLTPGAAVEPGAQRYADDPGLGYGLTYDRGLHRDDRNVTAYDAEHEG